MKCNDRLSIIWKFICFLDGFKDIHRFKNHPRCRGDSTAEHSFRLALSAMLVVKELNRNHGQQLDVLTVVKLVLCHDLPELITDDIDATLINNGAYSAQRKNYREQEAMCDIACMLPCDIGKELLELWQEYEHPTTPEGFCAKALDKMETLATIIPQGHTTFDDPEFLAIYGNKEVKNYPPLKPFFAMIKKELQTEFERGRLPWHDHYNDY